MALSCCDSLWPIQFVSILRRSWGSSTLVVHNVIPALVKHMILDLQFPALLFFVSGLRGGHLGKVYSSKNAFCLRAFLFTNLVEQFFTNPSLELSKMFVSNEKCFPRLPRQFMVLTSLAKTWQGFDSSALYF